MTDLIYMGSAVKALGNGKVAGYLVTFSDQTQPDLSQERDFFTAECDFDLDTGNRKSVFYSHGLDAKMGVKRIGIGDVKQDDVGVWIEAQLNVRDEYEKAIYKMAEDGKLGWSSGAPSHLVTRKAIETDTGTVHEIKTWPLAEASLTPCPADHRNQATTLKSLPSLLGMEEPPATKSRADFTYDDLRALLESEWNEDFPPQMTYGDPYDGWARQVHVVAMDDATCVGQRGWDGELIRRSYSVTSGNDVVWGDPQEVARTTSFVPITDGDDTMVSMMAGKQADVTALKEALTRSMTFSDHADVATSAMEGFVARAEKAIGMDIKAGRMISAANRAKMQKIHAGMRVAHDAMAEHMGKMDQMLADTDPDAKKDTDDFAALRTRFVRLQSELLNLTG